MKILHVWDQSGVGSTIAKYMDQHYETETQVITREAYDPYHQTNYGTRYKQGTFAFSIIAFCKAMNTNIIHIDSFEKLLPYLLWHGKPLIMHYHGSDIRTERKHWFKWADRVLYSTPDLAELLPKNAIYMPNPVDTTQFKPTSKERFGAIYFQHPYESKGLASIAAVDLGVPLTITENTIPYEKMPAFLNQYEYFIDRFSIHSLSRMALEALACGCKVVNWNCDVVSSLPSEHRLENVARKLYDIYCEVTV